MESRNTNNNGREQKPSEAEPGPSHNITGDNSAAGSQENQDQQKEAKKGDQE